MVTEKLNEKLNRDIKKYTGRVFIIVNDTTVDDTYTTIIQFEHNGSVYRLITRIIKLPNKILEVTTKDSLWKDTLKQDLNSLTSNISPIVLIKMDSLSPLLVIKEIENIKTTIGFR